MLKTNTYAAIDIGSNAIRLLVNDIFQTETKTIFNKASLIRVPIRLGYDAFVNGEISSENLHRVIESMKAFQLLMDVHKVEKYTAFATSAMRESNNQDFVIQRVKEESGVDIKVISGKKEAQVVFETQLYDLVVPSKDYLYVDVGGGSTELTLFSNKKIIASKSFKIGTVRLLNKKVKESYLTNHVKPWIKEHLGDKNVELIGSGGNINYAYKLENVKVGKPLNYKRLRKRLKELSSLTYEQRIEKYNMKRDRADVIVPALIIYTSVMKWSKAKLIHVPKIGISDGMIQHMYLNENS